MKNTVTVKQNIKQDTTKFVSCFFFLPEEGGLRGGHGTGVKGGALPIFWSRLFLVSLFLSFCIFFFFFLWALRTEEGRGGKEGSTWRWPPY